MQERALPATMLPDAGGHRTSTSTSHLVRHARPLSACLQGTMWINAAYQAYVPISLYHAAGGQAPVRRARKKRVGGSKKRRRSAHAFVDDAAGSSSLAEGLPEGRETIALPSESEQSDYSETSQDSQAPSDHFIDPEDGYDEADVADLRDAEAAAAEADLLSQDSALWQHESMEAGSRQEHDTVLLQAIGSRPKGGVRLPKTLCLRPTGCCNKYSTYAHVANFGCTLFAPCGLSVTLPIL